MRKIADLASIGDEYRTSATPPAPGLIVLTTGRGAADGTADRPPLAPEGAADVSPVVPQHSVVPTRSMASTGSVTAALRRLIQVCRWRAWTASANSNANPQ